MGSVYFIQSQRQVKIGYARDVVLRVTQLQTGNPFRLQLLAELGGVTPSVERTYHRALAEHRHYGEWFDLAPLRWLVHHIQGGARPMSAGDILHYVALPVSAPHPMEGSNPQAHIWVRTAARASPIELVAAQCALLGPDYEFALKSYCKRMHLTLPFSIG